MSDKKRKLAAVVFVVLMFGSSFAYAAMSFF